MTVWRRLSCGLALVALLAFAPASWGCSNSGGRYVGQGALNDYGGLGSTNTAGNNESSRQDGAERGTPPPRRSDRNDDWFNDDDDDEHGEPFDEFGQETDSHRHDNNNVEREPRPRQSRPDDYDTLSEEEVRRIEELVGLLDGSLDESDELQQDIARKAEEELVKFGPKALPHLRRLARGSRALAVNAVKLQIRVAHPDAPPASAAPPRNRSGVDDDDEHRHHHEAHTRREGAGGEGGAGEIVADFEEHRGRLLRTLLEDDSLAGTRVDMEAVADFLLVRMREMERAAGRLDYDRAIEIGEAILTLAPRIHLRDQLKEVLDGYREAKLQMSLIGGRVACLEPEVRYGDEIPFRVVLKNVSQRRLTIYFTQRIPRSRAREDVYDSPIQLRVAFTQIAPTGGARISRSESVQLTAEGEVTLEPGEVWSKEWRFDTTTLGGQLEALGEVEVSGMIRPLRITSDAGEETARRIHLESATARIAAAGYERAQANPVGEIERALRSGDSVEIVLVALAARSAASEAERWQIIGMLLDRLHHAGSRMRSAIFSALAAITDDGINFGRDERHWRMWYEANRPN